MKTTQRMIILILGVLPLIAVTAQTIPEDERPMVCTMEYAPVCGEDGNTYGNECMAHSQGFEVAYVGECDETSQLPDQGSDSSDQIPDEDEGFFCPEYYQPVCGEIEVCDDLGCEIVRKTFSNICFASGYHATVIAEGRCEDLDDSGEEPGDSLVDLDTMLLQGQNLSLEVLVDRASGKGITIYTNPVAFMPEQSVTREQAAKMLFVILNDRIDSTQINVGERCQWNDRDRIDFSLLSWVDKACEAGLFQGSPDKFFMPELPLLQIDLTTVLERTIQYLPSVGNILAGKNLGVQDGSLHAYNAVSREEFLRVLWVISGIQDSIDNPYTQ